MPLFEELMRKLDELTLRYLLKECRHHRRTSGWGWTTYTEILFVGLKPIGIWANDKSLVMRVAGNRTLYRRASDLDMLITKMIQENHPPRLDGGAWTTVH